MRRLSRSLSCLTSFALCFLASFASAQTNYTTNITLAKLLGSGGPSPYATVCAYGADIYGNPISFSAPTWGLILKGSPAGCGNVVNGALTAPLPVPDAYHTNQTGPIYYNLVVQPTNVSGTPTGTPIQFNAVSNITGTTWALDTFAPTGNTPFPASNTIAWGASVPGSCTSPSIFVGSNSPIFGVCNNGVYSLFTSGGNMSYRGAWSGSTSYNLYDVVSTGTAPAVTFYLSLVAGNTAPLSNTTDWQMWGGSGTLNYAGIVAALGYTPQATGGIPAGLLNGQWDFTTMAANTVADQSGSGNAILCGAAGGSGLATPGLSAQGLTFSGVGGVANSGCDLPAALNGDRTFIFLVSKNPLPLTTYNNSSGNYASNSPEYILASSLANGMYLELQALQGNYFMSPGMQTNNNSTYTFSGDRAVGWHVVAFTLGTNAGTDPNQTYIDGVPTTPIANVGVAAGVQTAIGGHYQLGAKLNVGSFFDGTVALGAAAAGELNQAQIQQITLYMQGLAPTKNIVLNPPAYRASTPKVVVDGDSIAACYLVSPSTACAVLNLTTKLSFTPVNQGIGGIQATSVVANFPIRTGLYGIPQTGQNVVIWEAGTNDFAQGGGGSCVGSSPAQTAQAVFANAVAWSALNHAAGNKTIVETVPSGALPSVCTQSGLSTFTATLSTSSLTLTSVSSTTGLQVGQILSGTGIAANTEITAISGSTVTINQLPTAAGTGVTITPSGYSKDQLLAVYNPIIRTQWAKYFDGIADTAADPHFAPGTFVNGTYYADLATHLTAAAQPLIESAYNYAIDRVTVGSSPSNCDSSTILFAASPYADTAADGCKVVDTAGGNVVVNLMTALYQTGVIKKYCNNSSSGSNTLTINAPSDFPFNNLAGSTSITVPQNTCKEFESTLVSLQTGGDFWRQLN